MGINGFQKITVSGLNEGCIWPLVWIHQATHWCSPVSPFMNRSIWLISTLLDPAQHSEREKDVFRKWVLGLRMTQDSSLRVNGRSSLYCWKISSFLSNSTANTFPANKISVKTLCLTHSDRAGQAQDRPTMSKTMPITSDNLEKYPRPHQGNHRLVLSSCFPSLPFLKWSNWIPILTPMLPPESTALCNLFLLQSVGLYTVPPTVHHTETLPLTPTAYIHLSFWLTTTLISTENRV